MHSCFRVYYFELLAQLPANRFAESRAAFHVEHAHPANVAREVAFLDEIGEGCLVERGRKNVGGFARGIKCADEIFRNNHVAQAQGGEQNLAKCADVDDASVRVHALQGSDRVASEAIFAVVIVFDNPRAGAGSPIEKLHTTGGAHRGAHWILVRRRDVYGSRFGAAANTFSYVETVTIDGNRNKF